MFKKWKDYIPYLIPFVVAVTLFSLITDYEKTIGLLKAVFGNFFYVITRFLIAFFLAYILNFLVEFLRKKCRFPRWLAVSSAYLLFLGSIVWFFLYITPILVDGIKALINLSPNLVPIIENFVTSVFSNIGSEDFAFLEDLVTQISKSVSTMLSGWLEFSALGGIVRDSTRLISNIIFGILISIYALWEKDRILVHCKKILYALITPKRAEKTQNFMREANKIFSQFFLGRFLESFIVGIISVILYVIFGLKFAPFLAVIAAIFNLIPYFGPVIGGAVTVILLLVADSPLHALYGLIITVVVQALDGWVIGVKILGDAVGISPLLTIVAITIGGDVGGLLGIFLGIPIFAAAKILIYDKLIAAKLHKRGVQIE